MSKQTAIEWLIKQLIPKDQHEGIMDIIEEAKEMEKEQIEEAWKLGNLPTSLGRVLTAQDYYNETYGADK